MIIKAFDWDDINREHINKHQVGPDEVEESFAGKHHLFTARDGRHILLGRSVSGRYLFIVFEYKSAGVIYTVTARDMSSGERRLHRRKI